MNTFLEKVILYNLYKINGQRSISSIYHLFNGKKSSQTIQDAHFFHLSSFFNTYKDISRENLDSLVKKFIDSHVIEAESIDHYLLTDIGYNHISSLYEQYPFLNHLNGWKYQYYESFWERLTLFVQVVSNIKHKEIKYAPIQRGKDVQNWVKQFLNSIPFPREELGSLLYRELVHCLDQSTHHDPSVLVIRLSGYNAIGLTDRQASDVLGVEPSLYHFQFLSCLHFLIESIEKDRGRYPLLMMMIEDLQNEIPLTTSTKKTYSLINNGYSIEEVALMRRLKIATIQDHIVEIAINSSLFSIDPYISKEKQRIILETAKDSPSKQLKYIRQLIQDVDYFEIRLVLAKYGDKK